jgi:hypothetical protein
VSDGADIDDPWRTGAVCLWVIAFTWSVIGLALWHVPALMLGAAFLAAGVECHARAVEVGE